VYFLILFLILLINNEEIKKIIKSDIKKIKQILNKK